MNKQEKDLVPINELIAKAKELSFEISTSLDTNKGTPEENAKIIKSTAKVIGQYQQVVDRLCVQIGFLLFTVKILLPYGMFGRWVAENCPFSHRTANNLMNCYRICLSHPELLLLPKSVIYLLGSKNFHKKVLEQLAVFVACGYEINREVALKLQNRYLNGEISLDDDEITKYLEKQCQNNLFNACKVDWEKHIILLEKKVVRFKALISEQSALAGRKLNNEYTAYWESSIYVYEETIKNLSQLCDGKIVKSKKKSSGPVRYYDDSWLSDESLLYADHITPDDLLPADISDWELEQYYT